MREYKRERKERESGRRQTKDINRAWKRKRGFRERRESASKYGFTGVIGLWGLHIITHNTTQHKHTQHQHWHGQGQWGGWVGGFLGWWGWLGLCGKRAKRLFHSEHATWSPGRLSPSSLFTLFSLLFILFRLSKDSEDVQKRLTESVEVCL